MLHYKYYPGAQTLGRNEEDIDRESGRKERGRCEPCEGRIPGPSDQMKREEDGRDVRTPRN